MDLSLWFERTRTPSWGLFGGEDGSVPEVIISAGTADERSLLRVDSLPLPKGTRFRVATGGGGGYGFPWERDYQHVREDVNDGYVSRAMARECYGVVLREGSLAVDEEGTYKLRKQRSGAVAGNEGAPLQSREARW
jgi:N-methylhydantoinase B